MTSEHSDDPAPGRRPGDPDGDDTRWTVMTWNVHGIERPDVGALAEVIAAASPDVVVVQEVRRRQASRLAGRLGFVHRWDRKHYPATPLLPCLAEGLAMLSPHELVDGGAARISEESSTWSYRRRIAQWATVRRGADEVIWVCNLHLSPESFAAERRAEARRAAELATEHAGGLPVIVAGDLNDADDPTVIALLPGIEHVRPGPTNPADVPVQVLDHVLLPADARDVDTFVPDGGASWAALSDHLPVTCRSSLP